MMVVSVTAAIRLAVKIVMIFFLKLMVCFMVVSLVLIVSVVLATLVELMRSCNGGGGDAYVFVV